MNILHLISSAGLFGAENVLLELAKSLNKSVFFHPIVGVFNNSFSQHLEILDASIQERLDYSVINCKGRLDLNAILALRKLFKNQKIEIIHSHGYKSNLYGYLASRGLGIPTIATCHNWLGETRRMRFYASLDLLFLKKFDWITCVSDAVKETIIGSGVPSHKVNIIQNGISLDRFNIANSTNLRHKIGVAEDAIVIGTVGRISAEKGHKYLLQITNDILNKFPKVVFLIIGDGVLKDSLQKEYDSPSIIFTGLRKDVPVLYQCMDIFVLPSLTEGLPMVILEAMASKLSIIATQVGEIPNVVINGESGLLVEPADEDGLKRALFYLLDNMDKAKEMGQKGYQRVKEHFSSERMAKEYIAIYQNLLNSPN